ncbi:hypothetical protein [Aquimarina sp. 2201CG5-10]|uniref:hypothetical protein n=1 Tax=Aquimarina callyspongiae TaxID=3098150 RepID=UPI002AB5638D|nr:hypothetical protein [Aquimarina sp. 2201CG5-10]MDY8138211.1 hypothetical protein [Aquimarina sp. 2201CG5-10]
MKKFKSNLSFQSLNRSEMKTLTGGGIPGTGGSGSCGSCKNPGGGSGNYGCYKQQGGSTNGQCRCLWQSQSCS